jgi:hypothetical protein
MRFRSSLLIPAIALLTFLAASPQVLAAEDLTIETDHSQMVILPGLPGSVVVGNPAIADATVEGTRLFIHGRGFGTTNIMVLDLTGNEVATFSISVSHITPNAVALFSGTNRISFNCAPLCEMDLQVGDNHDHFKSLHEQLTKKSALVTGSDSAKSEAPPVPQ